LDWINCQRFILVWLFLYGGLLIEQLLSLKVAMNLDKQKKAR
jgi:hypothetical protein